MAINKMQRSWGYEVVIHNMVINNSGSVRLYWNKEKKKLVIDFSINQNSNWTKKLSTENKYGKGSIKVSCEDETKLDSIIYWFNS